MAHPPTDDQTMPANQPSFWHRHLWPLLSLAALFIGLVLLHLIWLALNDRPPMWDSALHLANALEYYRYLQGETFSVSEFLSISYYYPPLFYLSLLPLFLVRIGPDSATLLHLPFLLALMLSVYYLGMTFTGRRTAGVTAAAWCVLFPHVLWLSREVMIDLETVAWTAGLVALAVASQRFRRRTVTLLWGLAGGLAVLYKWSIVFYAGPPLLWLLAAAFRGESDRDTRRPAAHNILSGLLLGAVVAWPWYLKNFPFLLSHFQPYTQGLGPVEGDPGVWTLAGWLFYLRALLGWQLFLPFFLLFVFAVVWAIRRRPPHRGLLFCWLGGTYLIFSLFANKAPRHITPVLPAVAVLLVIAVWGVRSTILRRGLITAGCLVAVFQAWMVSFGIPWLPVSVTAIPLPAPAFQERIIECQAGDPVAETIRTWPDGWFLYHQEAFGIFGPPREENWRIPDILAGCATDAADTEQAPSLGLVPDCTRFNVWSFRSIVRIMDLELRIWRVGEPEENGRNFDPYRYVLVTCGLQGPVWGTERNAPLMRYLRDHPERFVPLAEWPLPDDSVALLYKNLVVRETGEDFRFR
ncbi:MAG: hypothetical protein JXQ27_14735 [Acidobacteria bacterium]|nr:hypothetical protein [Acidobacteriota bacterium]